jgi:hypothetical protein
MGVKTDYLLSEVITPGQAGFELRLSVPRIRQLVDAGVLESVRDSAGRRMIVKASVVKLLERRKGK